MLSALQNWFKLVFRPFWTEQHALNFCPDQTSQEGIKYTNVEEQFRVYCPNIYNVPVCFRICLSNQLYNLDNLFILTRPSTFQHRSMNTPAKLKKVHAKLKKVQRLQNKIFAGNTPILKFDLYIPENNPTIIFVQKYSKYSSTY